MDTIIVANPRAAAGRVGSRWKEVARSIEECLGPAEARFTGGAGDATRLAREAVRSGCSRVVAVGGDGTINEVVNGLFAEGGDRAAEVTLVVFPAGTGGDFVRSIGLSGARLGDAFAASAGRRIDAGRATFVDSRGEEVSRYFINISSFGASGLIVEKVNKASKRLGGKTSFFMGTIKGLLQYRNKRVRLRVDDHFDEEMVINTVAVANGRYFGGSMMIAPAAILDDGLFDVITIGDVGAATFVRYSGKIYRGEHLGLAEISSTRGRVVEATAIDGEEVLIDLDGEQPGRLPVRYELLPGAIEVLAPWSEAEGVRHPN